NGAKLASITGRYFAMDRDTRWERVKKAYDAAVNGIGTKTTDPVAAIKQSYADGTTDEFLEPLVITENDAPVATIKEGDVVLFFNYRTDRGRELTRMLSQEDFPEQDTKKLDLYYVTMTNYDQTFKNIHIIFDKDNLTNTIGEVVSKAGKKQIRIAETEKYPHVTFFFSGGREKEFEGETRLIAKSPDVATYDLQPEMSAYEVRDKITAELKKEEVDFVCLNFANPDMVGHTGVIEAAIAACEAVDSCAKDVIETGLEHGYSTIVIADHGNCETMKNEDGSPNTAHTTNPVPIIVVDNDIKSVKDGILGNVSPTILDMMGVDKPEEMDQESLVS
ncbi:MAG: 2,3-bisphosphoglycerate-independent phosphoglycerate mutase, partial [Bacteroidota bacterium]|nr:2,3-bisphosphoglycerate-independent phosphoglycerate mutase [Bacteroidota bacterium]